MDETTEQRLIELMESKAPSKVSLQEAAAELIRISNG